LAEFRHFLHHAAATMPSHVRGACVITAINPCPQIQAAAPQESGEEHQTSSKIASESQ
jgi:hypothetical protein